MNESARICHSLCARARAVGNLAVADEWSDRELCEIRLTADVLRKYDLLTKEDYLIVLDVVATATMDCIDGLKK